MSNRGEPAARSPRPWTVGFAVLLAWIGLFVHNAFEFPNLPSSRPEYAVPTLIWLGSFLAWLSIPARGWPTLLLRVWGGISLAGAIITVLPLPVLPFRPEQSIRHYGVHVIYAVTQLPVLSLMWRRRP